MFRLPIVKFFSRFINRITITLALILVQVVWMASLYLRLIEYAAWLNVVMVVLSVLIILFLVRKDENPAYTIAWMALIGITPVFGGLMYLFWGNKRPSRRMRRRMAAVDRRHRGLVAQHPDQVEDLPPRAKALTDYVARYGPWPAWQDTAARYYSSGEEMFPHLLDDLRRAEKFIFLETFIIRPGKMWDAVEAILREKAAAGVDVRVIYDDMGCLTTVPSGFVIRLEQAHIRCIPFNPVVPLVSLVYNISPAPEGEPVLLSWDNTETMFHEFGHALHGFFTRGKYRRIAGTIPRDMVELPSQVMENWASEPEVLRTYARHYETGEPMPDEMIAKIQESGHFNQGFATVEFIAAALLDMEWHSVTAEGKFDVEAFEREFAGKYGLMEEIAPRYRTTYFSHIFDGGYAAGYYVYLWAEVLDADTFNAFKSSGDIFNRELAERFRKHVLAEGGYADAMEQYVKFRGETPSEEALLEKRGLK